ncbi:MAG: class I SAM-dependent methyltransferase, partial [Myxococcota bacterium]|nr:class I SAM-dependent methyltransferase [Myxococcota bacterium]
MLPLLGQAVVRKRAFKRLLAGHLWVYKSDMAFESQEAGLVEVLDPQGGLFGQALFSPRSQIALRLLSRDTTHIDKDFILKRFHDALLRREHLLSGLTSYRLIHGEGDLLPGLFVERYGDAFVVQSTCAAAALLEPLCIEWIKEDLSPRLIVVNNTTRSRRTEGLELYRKVVHGTEPAEASFVEHGFTYSTNLLEDQKTGSFFDQRDNHGQIAKYAFGRGLDAFTYHGGFALNMARTCTTVEAIDLSATALAKTQMHAEQAGFAHIEVVKADVMKYLPTLVAAGKRFDTIVLDP